MTRLKGAAAGFGIAVVVVLLGQVELWWGTEWPLLWPMGPVEAALTLVLFPIIGAVTAGDN